MSRIPTPLPPGPRAAPLWQLYRYNQEPLPYLEECARRFGQPFTLRFPGHGTFVMLTAADAIKDVFRGDPRVLHSGEGNQFLTPTVGPTSVLVLDDEPHARQRRILLPPLKGERMRAFFEAMQAATLDMVRTWPVGRPVRTVEPMQQITLRVILQAVLGLSSGPSMEALEGEIRRMLLFGRSRYGLILATLLPQRLFQNARWLPYYRQLCALGDAIRTRAEECRRTPAGSRGEHVLTDLVEATHEDGTPLTGQEIRDAVVTLLLAGHDTTALALAWALEQVTARPDVMACIAEELRRTTGGGLPQASHVSRLEYLDAAIRESLRLRTILPFVVRKTKEPFTAGGREYPAGVVLCPCNHLVHRNPDLYPQPTKFRPERFLERNYAGHEWFPFGGGNRTCLGMAFALYEMKVVLSTLFASVRLTRPPGARSAPVRRGVSLAPDDGAQVVVG